MKDIEFKNNDNLINKGKLIPLLSNIDDKEGVLIEHGVLNGNSNNLKYALIKYNNKYYFMDVEKAIMELKLYTDNQKIMCPNCKQDLYIMQGYKRKNGTEVKAHLKHYINSEECEFKQYYNSKHEKINKGKYKGESEIHKNLKLSVATKINDKGMYFNIPKAYSIEVKGYECWANIEYEEVYIEKAEIEKWAIKRGDVVGGYKPDITAYDKSNKEIYIEVTYQTGKTIEYYDKWKSLNKTVLEVRKNDNVYIEKYYDDEEVFIEDIYIYDDKMFRFLYDPVLDEARREKLKTETLLADKEREYKRNKECVGYIYDKLKEVINYLKYNENIKVIKEDREYKYNTVNGYVYKNYWFKATFKGASINLKIPNIVVNLLNKIEGLKVEYIPYKSKYIA